MWLGEFRPRFSKTLKLTYFLGDSLNTFEARNILWTGCQIYKKNAQNEKGSPRSEGHNPWHILCMENAVNAWVNSMWQLVFINTQCDSLVELSGRQSYKRDLVLKKTKLVLHFLIVCYLNWDYTTVMINNVVSFIKE